MLNNKEYNGAEKKIAKTRVADSSFSKWFWGRLKGWYTNTYCILKINKQQQKNESKPNQMRGKQQPEKAAEK